MDILNLGIFAHVDAGKTSLTERLLFNAGVIDSVGSVDRGDTQTDSLELERRRGITIRSAVVSFRIDELTVNVIDTPGHSDFVAEVERALRVLDGAILVVSAVEGIQARTRILMRSLVRLRIPTLVFVNKVDRVGARDTALVDEIRDSMSNRVLPMQVVEDLGTPAAQVKLRSWHERNFADCAADLIGDYDEAFMERYLEDGPPDEAALNQAVAEHVARCWIHPVYFGSAITGAGVDALLRAIHDLLPRAATDDRGPMRATIFKIERGPSSEKLASVRVHSGRVPRRGRVPIFRRDRSGAIQEFEGRISTAQVFDHGATTVEAVGGVGAGRIARLRGLGDAKVGDQLGTADGLPTGGLFAPPTLETIVRPVDPLERPALHAALERLAEQDPLIDVHLDPETTESSVRLFGEVQKEVITSVLATDFGLRVRFEQSRTICVEKLIGVGEALEEISTDEINYFWATVGLRVEPGAEGSGLTFGLTVELGSLPLSFHRAIEETVQETLRRGIYGWEVIDCRVTLTRSGFASPVSAAGDFRNATPLVLAAALEQARTQVYEPVHRFELSAPTSTMGRVGAALSAAWAIPEDHQARGQTVVVRGTVPAGEVHRLSRDLPELTRGEGLLVTEFGGYRPVSGPPPVRPRSGADPFNRAQYMLHALGRSSAVG